MVGEARCRHGGEIFGKGFFLLFLSLLQGSVGRSHGDVMVDGRVATLLQSQHTLGVERETAHEQGCG